MSRRQKKCAYNRSTFGISVIKIKCLVSFSYAQSVASAADEINDKSPLIFFHFFFVLCSLSFSLGYSKYSNTNSCCWCFQKSLEQIRNHSRKWRKGIDCMHTFSPRNFIAHKYLNRFSTKLDVVCSRVQFVYLHTLFGYEIQSNLRFPNNIALCNRKLPETNANAKNGCTFYVNNEICFR